MYALLTKSIVFVYVESLQFGRCAGYLDHPFSKTDCCSLPVKSSLHRKLTAGQVERAEQTKNDAVLNTSLSTHARRMVHATANATLRTYVIINTCSVAQTSQREIRTQLPLMGNGGKEAIYSE